MNYKKCNRCGMVNTVDAQNCGNCGEYFGSDMSNELDNSINNKPIKNNDKMADILSVISILLFFLGYTAMTFIGIVVPDYLKSLFKILNNVSPFVGIIIMIVGRAKYPNSNSLRVVMWAIIITIILYIIYVIISFFLLAGFFNDLGNADWSKLGILIPYRFW